MPALSLITCTRNPRPDLLARVEEGIAALRVPTGWGVERILVDSASAPALLAHAPWDRLVRCETPGLAAARQAGIAATGGEILVWFDDDNVPDAGYLDAVVATARAHPEVSVWGAGRIAVEFTDPVPGWVAREFRPFFQQRAHAHDEFGRSTAWASFFPVGSGLVTRRAAAERWADALRTGRYSLTGRKGSALTAGDDAQLIFGAIAAGETVGVVAAQALTHLIPPARCTIEYLARMEFGISASLRIARAECFPGEPQGHADLSLVDAARAAVKAMTTRGILEGPRHARLELGRRLGAVAGAHEVERRPEPAWLRAAIAALGLR